MPLSPRQEVALEVLDWLLDDHESIHRRTGRSFIMAVAYVRIAARNPGRWVTFTDHYPEGQAVRVVRDYIQSLTSSDNQLDASFRELNRFMVSTPTGRPIPDWMPQDMPEGIPPPGEVAARQVQQHPPPEPPTWHERIRSG